MFLDVFGVLRMLSRCVQMVTNLGCWISSRSSLGVLLMFSGCSDESCERGGSGGLVGLLDPVGLGGLMGLGVWWVLWV